MTPSNDESDVPAGAGGEALLACPWQGGGGPHDVVRTNDAVGTDDGAPHEFSVTCWTCGFDAAHESTRAASDATWNRTPPAPDAEEIAREIVAAVLAEGASLAFPDAIQRVLPILARLRQLPSARAACETCAGLSLLAAVKPYLSVGGGVTIGDYPLVTGAGP